MDISRRNLFIGAAALVAVGGVGYVVWRGGFGSEENFRVPLAELLQPGPFPDMAMGSETAPVTIVEYASLTCPHCKAFGETTFPELKKRYIDTGKVRYIFREFVLNDVDMLAIALARCVSNEAYFPFIQTLFEKQEQWATESPVQPLLALTKQAGMSEQKFNECISNQQIVDNIVAQRDRASDKFRVNSTPTFFINGERRSGSLSITELESAMKPYLTEK